VPSNLAGLGPTVTTFEGVMVHYSLERQAPQRTRSISSGLRSDLQAVPRARIAPGNTLRSPSFEGESRCPPVHIRGGSEPEERTGGRCALHISSGWRGKNRPPLFVRAVRRNESGRGRKEAPRQRAKGTRSGSPSGLGQRCSAAKERLCTT
jgi:hypothetical protein